MAFARLLGVVNAAILLTIVYVVVFGIASMIAKLLGKDLLNHRQMSGSFWKKKEPISHTLDQARHQF